MNPRSCITKNLFK